MGTAEWAFVVAVLAGCVAVVALIGAVAADKNADRAREDASDIETAWRGYWRRVVGARDAQQTVSALGNLGSDTILGVLIRVSRNLSVADADARDAKQRASSAVSTAYASKAAVDGVRNELAELRRLLERERRAVRAALGGDVLRVERGELEPAEIVLVNAAETPVTNPNPERPLSAQMDSRLSERGLAP